MQRRAERRTILLAVIASLLLHFAVAISLAAFGGKLQPPVPQAEKPIEMTFIDSTPTPFPVAPKNAPLVETSQNRETKEQPKEKTFESNANSIAASQQPGAGNAPVPTQDGKERSDLELDSQRYSLAMSGRTPRPKVEASSPTPSPSVAALTPTPTAAPTRTPAPSAAPSPTPEPTAEEQLAMLRATPPPPMEVPEQTPTATPEISTPPPVARPTPSEQETPAASYRREQVPTRMQGSISNRGVSSVNAIGTPLGRYSKNVHDAIGSRWYALVRANGDRINIGTVLIGFSVDRSGRITKIKILSNTADESFSNLCLQSVQDAKVPPMAEDVADALPPEGFQETLSFTIYPN